MDFKHIFVRQASLTRQAFLITLYKAPSLISGDIPSNVKIIAPSAGEKIFHTVPLQYTKDQHERSKHSLRAKLVYNIDTIAILFYWLKFLRKLATL